ncbi:flagellar brake protein [Arhodomonas aquaeolei]|uniref:flagellar brake protein n=1 Tax=Arhodomonas aquaeolei TaxID=2369 RepID=UPI0003632640|nr:flagellar brake protein [Arhodomonas aquaeolei]
MAEAMQDTGELFFCGLNMQLQVPGYASRVITTLLGARDGQYLALHDNGANGGGLERLRLRPGDPLVVRFFHEGVAYGFRSYVRQLLREPEPMVFIAYPEETQSFALRQTPRVNCRLPARVRVGDDGEESTALVLDVSEHGCRVALPIAPAVDENETLHISLALPEETEPLVRFSADVRRRSEEEGRQVLGLSADLSQTFQRLGAYFPSD